MTVVILGAGGVAKAILEALPKIKWIPLFVWQRIVIVEPRDLDHTQLLEPYKWTHRQVALTPQNLEKELNDILHERDIVFDCTVNVDAIAVMKICHSKECLYYAASVENWLTPKPEILDTSPTALTERSLYNRELLASETFGHRGVTMIASIGMNCGLISCFALRGIRHYAEFHNKKQALNLISNGKWGEAAKILKLRMITVTERDTTKTRKAAPSTGFTNTWSSVGLVAESLDGVQVGRGSHEPEFGIKPTSGGPGHVRLLPVRGMDLVQWSYAPSRHHKGQKFLGFTIPHSECTTLSQFLLHEDYSVTCSFCYRPCEAARQSLQRLRANNYKAPPENEMHVLTLDEIEDRSYDCVGALLLFEDGTNWWSGTILDGHDVKKLGFEVTDPTLLQVSISMLSACKFALDSPFQGYLTPEYLPIDEMLDRCSPFLGRIYSAPVEGKFPIHFHDFIVKDGINKM
jgi:homospermidine synthase